MYTCVYRQAYNYSHLKIKSRKKQRSHHRHHHHHHRHDSDNQWNRNGSLQSQVDFLPSCWILSLSLSLSLTFSEEKGNERRRKKDIFLPNLSKLYICMLSRRNNGGGGAPASQKIIQRSLCRKITKNKVKIPEAFFQGGSCPNKYIMKKC